MTDMNWYELKMCQCVYFWFIMVHQLTEWPSTIYHWLSKSLCTSDRNGIERILMQYPLKLMIKLSCGRGWWVKVILPRPWGLVSCCRWDIEAEQVSAGLTSSARGNAGIWPQFYGGIREQLTSPHSAVATTSLFSSTHNPSNQTNFNRLPRVVVIATCMLADALGDHFLTEILGVLAQ